MEIETRHIALRIAELAREKKAQRVVVLDMSRVVNFCDYFVIASGTSLRQVNALAEAIEEELAKRDIHPSSEVYPQDQSGWIALDFGQVIVHLFHKPLREFYALEELWSDAKRIRIPRKGAVKPR